MAIPAQYQSDVDAILSRRHDLGADYWTTPDARIMKGAPFSTVECANYLLELGMEHTDPILQAVAELCWSVWKPDGRLRGYASSPLPCQTAPIAALLCRLGFAGDPRLAVTFEHFLSTQYSDGGWRCPKFPFGQVPGTEWSNPLPTLYALAAFSHQAQQEQPPALSESVDFLLRHWETRKPIGPCQYGIGTLFMQVEYPFRGYNLFHYVYVLSHYEMAQKDPRFLAALAALEAKLVDGQVVVERVVPKLAKLNFCRKGIPSALATQRYHEIRQNVGV